jgi:starch-binding outer membrane protein, SusD/RagB family
MKNKNLKISLFAFFLISIITFISCDKKLELTNPNNLTVESYFKTSGELVNGVNAAYGILRSPNLVGREWFFLHDTRGDEMSTGGGQLEAERQQMLSGNTDPTNPIIAKTWSSLYVMIHRANTVISNATGGADNPSLSARAVGEAKFLRAWAYNELVSQWGGVPLITTPVTSPTDFKPRASEAAVYGVIIQDLVDAAAVLPEKSAYLPTPTKPDDRGRATKSAANFLLGRVYMQTGNYPAAKAALLLIPTTGTDGYGLTNRFSDNFEEEFEFNNESIFEVVYVDRGDNAYNWNNQQTGDGRTEAVATIRNQEYNAVAWRNLIPSNKYLANFEQVVNGSSIDDPRLKFTVYQTGDLINNNTQTLTDAMQNGNSSVFNSVTKKFSWRKYALTYKEFVTGVHPGGNNQRLFRYAEVLLNLAECEAEANNFSTVNGAGFYLNKLRARSSVNMPAYPTATYLLNDKTNTIRTIMHEKFSEMGAECVRNIDIIRWRKKGYFGADPLSYFRPNRDELQPIPQQEIDNNPKLGDGGVPKQNPGY